MQAPPKKPISGFLWMFAGLCIGLFVALLVYLQGQPKSEVSFADAINQEVEKAKQQAKIQQEEKKNNPNREFPKFDFYTILKEHEVFIPDSEVNSKKTDARASAPAENESSEPEKSYVLQVGSFQNFNDADKRRATLALLGITSSIQEVQINNDTWHRVKVGPLSDKKQLNKVRDQLIDNDIPSLIMVLK